GVLVHDLPQQGRRPGEVARHPRGPRLTQEIIRCDAPTRGWCLLAESGRERCELRRTQPAAPGTGVRRKLWRVKDGVVPDRRDVRRAGCAPPVALGPDERATAGARVVGAVAEEAVVVEVVLPADLGRAARVDVGPRERPDALSEVARDGIAPVCSRAEIHRGVARGQQTGFTVPPQRAALYRAARLAEEGDAGRTVVRHLTVSKRDGGPGADDRGSMPCILDECTGVERDGSIVNGNPRASILRAQASVRALARDAVEDTAAAGMVAEAVPALPRHRLGERGPDSVEAPVSAHAEPIGRGDRDGLEVPGLAS